MQLNLLLKHPNPINVICFSEDENVLFGFSKYYNEFFEINKERDAIQSLGKLEDERDEFELIFQMIYCCKKILFIPRNAQNFHLYDIQTRKQKIIYLSEFSGMKELNLDSFFWIVRKQWIYLIYRKDFSLYKLDVHSSNIEHINQKYEHLGDTILGANIYKNHIALFMKKLNKVYIFDASCEDIKEVILDKETALHTNSYYDGENIWMYHNVNNKIYKCDLKGNIRNIYRLERSLQRKQLIFRFYQKEKKIFLLPNIHDYYYEILDNKLALHHFKHTDLCHNARYLIGEDLQYQYYMSLPMKSDQEVPFPYVPLLQEVKYKRLNKVAWDYEDYNMPIVENTDINNARRRICEAYMRAILPVFGEYENLTLKTYLELLLFIKRNRMNLNDENKTIGKSIYKVLI